MTNKPHLLHGAAERFYRSDNGRWGCWLVYIPSLNLCECLLDDNVLAIQFDWIVNERNNPKGIDFVDEDGQLNVEKMLDIALREAFSRKCDVSKEFIRLWNDINLNY